MLILNIENAFASVNYPGDARIVYDNSGFHLECEQTKEAFKGKGWKELMLPFIIDHYAALYFFTAEAFQFYLPAYLVASVKHYDQADRVPGAVIFSLTLRPLDQVSRDSFFSKIELFSVAQKKVIIEFLEFMRDEHGEDFSAEGPVEALKSYWSNNLSSGQSAA
jgi:hypothetical protein